MARYSSAVERIFLKAAKLEDVERERFLDTECKGRKEIRERVEVLLKAYRKSEGFLEDRRERTTLPKIGKALLRMLPNDEKIGDRIDRYRLVERIGEGGWGVVWLAEQYEPLRRKVALKILKVGLDTEEFIVRFESERQALALMEHPNIAKIFDGGATEKGRPYFVMEYVGGARITSFCDEEKFDVRRRLQLFLRVCHAVQHAHQKGVIHRDLKPSNILVENIEGDLAPKIIDFGISKIVESQSIETSLITRFQSFMGTPAYASPELIKFGSGAVDARSDFFCLGLLLCELLAGGRPHGSEELNEVGIEEFKRRVCEEESPRLSKIYRSLSEETRIEVARNRGVDEDRLAKLLSGDIEWIVLKCLEIEPGRRYASANELANDVECYLNSEPVSVGPPTTAYRLKKWVVRNRVAFAFSAATCLILLVASIVSLKMAFKANDEAERSARMASYLKEMFRDVEPLMALGRDDKYLREIVAYREASIEKDLASYPEIQEELSEVLDSIRSKLGNYESHGQNDALKNRNQVTELFNEADALEKSGHLDEATVKFRQAAYLTELNEGPNHWRIGFVLGRLGHVYLKMGDLDNAESAFRRAIENSERRGEFASRMIAERLGGLGQILTSKGDYEGAEKQLIRANEIWIALRGPDDPYLAKSIRQLAEVYLQAGRNEEGLEQLEYCQRIYEKAFGMEHGSVILVLDRTGQVLSELGRLEQALAAYLDALGRMERRVGADSPKLAGLLKKAAGVYHRLGHLDRKAEVMGRLDALKSKLKVAGANDDN